MTKDYYSKQPDCAKSDQKCWNRELRGVSPGPACLRCFPYRGGEVPPLPPLLFLSHQLLSPVFLPQLKPKREYVLKANNAIYNLTGLSTADFARLRTGQEVKLRGRAIAGFKGKRSWAAVAGSLEVTKEPKKPPQKGKVTIKKRGLLASGGLGTVTRTDVNTLVIPLSFAGCATSAGTTYAAPTYTQEVRWRCQGGGAEAIPE